MNTSLDLPEISCTNDKDKIIILISTINVFTVANIHFSYINFCIYINNKESSVMVSDSPIKNCEFFALEFMRLSDID
jgi:hypothetical protein